jgi:outer membrane beta-barrel protein
MKNSFKYLFILTSMLVGMSVHAAPADGDSEELNLIEMELDKTAPQKGEDENQEPSTTRTSPADQAKPSTDMTYEDLTRMTDFKQVSVIQKRYLPRTGRFQAFVGPSMTLNDPWYNVMGASFKLGYNFTESLGIEGNYSFMSTDKTQAQKELKQENNITTDSFVYTKSYYLIGVNWSPFYGKMTWLNKKIVYYDIYLTAGYGATTIQNNQSESTFSVGAGQIFSITKAYAFRWGIDWNFFNAKQIDASQGTYNNVIISAGLSFFFPEASYR